jgi:hypothetical protein
MTRIIPTIAVIVAAVTPHFGGGAEARLARNTCAGVLHQDAQQLWFGGAAGESEGICIIAPAQASKVLKVCAAGQPCRVVGVGADCPDSGECTEITRVDAVTRHKAPRRR